MNRPRYRVTFWRAYLLGVITVVFAGLLWQVASQPPAAYAQIPDSGAQRERMIRELVSTNQKLTQAVDLLKQIRDNTKAPTPDKTPRKPDNKRP